MYTGGEDGEIRKYDFINSINGQSLLTQVQKHYYVESVTQVIYYHWNTIYFNFNWPINYQINK